MIQILRPTVLVVLYAQCEGKIALGLVEPAKGAAGAFIFPQGGIEPGETPEGAARRELLQEIGLLRPIVRASVGTHQHWLPPERWEEAGYRGKEFSIVLVEADTMGVSPADEENRSFSWAFNWAHFRALIARTRPEKRAAMLRAIQLTGIWPPPVSDVPAGVWALEIAYASA